MILSLTAGTALLMWMGELISQRGVGNGMSLLIFASVVSTIPFDGARLLAVQGPVYLVAAIVVATGMMVAIIFIEQGQRRIPVQFSRRQVGRRLYGGQNTYIPLKVNQSGGDPRHLRQLDPVPAGAVLKRCELAMAAGSGGRLSDPA